MTRFRPGFPTIVVFVLAVIYPLPYFSSAAPQASSRDTIRLYNNLGDYQRPIGTTSKRARQYFDQGLQLGYAFGRRAAVRSFRTAQQHDPECAMCYWGEAWALGPYINNPRMRPANLEQVREAVEKARQLSETTRPANRILIEALAERYAEPADTSQSSEGRSRFFAPTRDSAYAAALEEAAKQYSEDADIAALFTEAVMVPTAKDYWTADGSPKRNVGKGLAALEHSFTTTPRHAGTCHLYIHAMESSPHPEKAERCADVIAELIPGASHIQHMPYHIYINIGRYGDAVLANKKARRIDQAAERDSAVAIYAYHNVNTLRYAATLDGQSAEALQAAGDFQRMDFPHADALYALTLARFGRWDEILEEPMPADDFDQMMVQYARGLAHLRNEDMRQARRSLYRLRQNDEDITREQSVAPHAFKQGDIADIARLQLEAEIDAAGDDYDAAISKLEEAIAVEDSLGYDDNEFFPIFTRHVLGAILLEAGRAGEAEAVYRTDLEDHPANGWALRGLEQSLRRKGERKAAEQVRRRFEEAWRRADVYLTSSRF